MPVIERSGQHRERGYAVEKDRDSEPKQGHEEAISPKTRSNFLRNFVSIQYIAQFTL